MLDCGFVTWRVFATKEQLQLEVPGRRTVRAGGETHLPITVRNPTDEPRGIALHLQGVPDCWPMALGTSRLRLAACQDTDDWLSIEPREPSETYPVQLRIVAEPVDDDLKPAVATVQVHVEEQDLGARDRRLAPSSS